MEAIELLDAVVAGRPTVHVRLVASDGHAGHGEAAPLPGYSPDDASTCRAALANLDRKDLEGSPWQASAILPSSLPAARFALETALIDLHSRQAQKPAWEPLAAAHNLEPAALPVPVPLSLLLTERDPVRLAEAARAAVSRGIRTLKLKVGRQPFVEELALARRVREAVGDGIALRLDANRAWSLDEARENLAASSELHPELVEEPTADLLALGQSPVPLALDESLQDAGALERIAPILETCRIRAIVLKPTTLGGFGSCLALARRAQELGLDVLVSHTFEGRIAFTACCALALAIASRVRASGLAPHAELTNSAVPGHSQSALHPWRSPGLGLQQ